MGESITEGTLTTLIKKVGDSVVRDEMVASIETDKIDVSVNTPQAGIITELFFKQGETVHVGAPLFKLDSSLETNPKSNPEKNSESNPEKNSESNLNLIASLSKKERVPLIKFIGKRELFKDTLIPSKDRTQSATTTTTTIGNVLRRHYESRSSMASRFHAIPVGKREMEIINVRFNH